MSAPMTAPTSAPTGTVAPAASESGRPSVLGAWLSVAAATLIWASNVVAVKFILREIPAFPAALLRIISAGAILALWHAAQRKPFWIRPADRSSLLQLGVVGIAWSFLCYTLALAHTSVAHTVFIGALSPMAVFLLVRLGGQEKFTMIKLAGLVVCLVGVLLLAADKAGGAGAGWTGDLLAFAGMWCFAFYTVRSKRLARGYDSVSLNTYAFVIAALFCLPLLLWTAASVPWGRISWVGWSALAYSATIGSAGAYLVYYYSLRTLAASQVAAFQYIQPVLSTCFGVVLLGETFGARFEAGAALILAGMFLAERR
jgi:drug/metabolite transporter (DMT)-like permease